MQYDFLCDDVDENHNCATSLRVDIQYSFYRIHTKNVENKIKDSYTPLRQVCIDNDWSKFLYERKQAKLQWLEKPSQINANNRNNVRLETSRHFEGKRGNSLKVKLVNLKRAVRTRALETCIGTSINLRLITCVELT